MWKRGGRVVNGDFQRTPEFREKPHRAHGYLEFHGMCEYRIVFSIYSAMHVLESENVPIFLDT